MPLFFVEGGKKCVVSALRKKVGAFDLLSALWRWMVKGKKGMGGAFCFTIRVVSPYVAGRLQGEEGDDVLGDSIRCAGIA